MADYSKQTVAQLRALLKDRGIPSTGLQRKAQIIEKLQEADTANVEAPSAPETSSDVVEQDAEAEGDSNAPEVPGSAPPEAGEPETRPTDDIVPELPPVPVATSDPEHAVGSKFTEPSGEEAAADKEEAITAEEIPDAPAPAAQASRFAQHEPDSPQRNIDTASKDDPALNEKPSVERAELLPIPERSTAETSRLNTEEFEADSKKRKRRSDTPELPLQDIRAKKQRPSQEFAPEVHLKEDSDVVMEQRPPAGDIAISTEDKTGESNGSHGVPPETDSLSVEPDIKREKKENVSRYKNLVKPNSGETPMDAITDDRPTVPALHPVTSALYIRNFMRPLRPEPLRAHLVSLASPPTGLPDSSIVKSIFLDAMKTHALVSFASTTAASRARASLHGSIWPPEGNRKELWVDFIPEDRVDEWIKEEEDAILSEKEARANGRSVPPKRFEVIYSESSDSTISAVFQEVGSGAPSNAPRGPRGSVDTHRPSTHQPPSHSTSAQLTDSRQDIEASFKTLDELFRSTEAKPQLFYLPVSDEISDARLKDLDNETSRDWAPGEIRKGRGIKMEMKYKYSFDAEDRVVEISEDRGPWSEAYGRGGFRGRGRGRGVGFFRGRGGDSWRGS